MYLYFKNLPQKLALLLFLIGGGLPTATLPIMAASLPQQADADSSSSEEEVFPLHSAVKKGDESQAKILVRYNPRGINLADEQGKTPLDYAIKGSKLYDWLVKKGAKASQGITHPSGDEVDDSKEADPGDSVTTTTYAQRPTTPKNLATQPPLPNQPTANHESTNPEQLHHVLVAHYQKQDKIPGMLGDAPQSITDCYIRLSLTTQATHAKARAKAITKRKDEEDEKEPARQDKATEELLEASLDYNQLYQVKVPIEVADLWKIELPQLQQAQRKDKDDNEKKDQEKIPVRTEPIRHIAIVGEAGSGKTTLTQRIAYQWAHQELWPNQFDWLLVIPLRSLYGLTDFARWEESMSKALDIPSLNAQDLRQLFHNPNQKGLLILDGYDEIAHKVQENPEGALGRFMAHCLNNKNLHLILTSRPVQLPTQLQQPRDLHVIGFQQAEIDQYVYAYFKHNPDIENPKNYAGQLLATLQQNPNLRLLSHTPLYLRLFCLLAKEGTPTDLADKPLTQLYQQLIDRFVSYAWQKKTGQKASTADAIAWSQMELTYLSYLAWLGMENSQAALSPKLQKEALQYVIQRFPRTDLSMPSYWQRIRDMGFLQNLSQAQYEPEGPTYFAHLTVQEFLAARFLAESLYRAPEPRFRIAQKALRDDKYTPRYQVMLPFVAGQLYHNVVQQDGKKSPLDPQAIALLHFWDLLQSQPRELSGIHHAVLVMRGLEACLADTSNSLPPALQKKHTQLLEESRDWLTAFWQQKYEDTYYHKNSWNKNEKLILSLPLASVLNQGLSTTHKVLADSLIVDALEDIFFPWWATEASEREIDNDNLWRDRYEKLEATSRVALATTTQHDILEAIKRRFTQKIDRKAVACIKRIRDEGGFTQHLDTVYDLLHRASTDSDFLEHRSVPNVLSELDKTPYLWASSRTLFLRTLTKNESDSDDNVWKVATDDLVDLTKNPHLTQESLLQLLNTLINNASDSDNNVWKAATYALGELAKNPHLAQESLSLILNTLTNNASDSDEDVRGSATQVLVEVAKNPYLAQKSLPLILNTLTKNASDSDLFSPYVANEALVELAKNPYLAQESLLLLLNTFTKNASDSNDKVREAATYHLGELAKNPYLAQKSLPLILNTLTKNASDLDSNVRKAADKSLKRLPKYLWQAVVDEQCTKPVDNSISNLSKILAEGKIVNDQFTLCAQALFRYNPCVVVSKQATQLAGYKGLVQALKQEAQKQDYPTAGYRASYLALPESIQAPELPRLQRVPHYYTTLHIASEEGDCKRLDQLCIAFPVYKNHAYNDTGSTPLLWAAQHGQWEAIKVLIQHGAWIDTTDLAHNTLLKLLTTPEQDLKKAEEKKQCLLEVLQHRTLFPEEIIADALQFVAEKCYDPIAKKTIQLDDQNYQKALLGAVAMLTGQGLVSLQNMMLERAPYYEASLRRIIEIKKEAYGKTTSYKGLHTRIEDILHSLTCSAEQVSAIYKIVLSEDSQFLGKADSDFKNAIRDVIFNGKKNEKEKIKALEDLVKSALKDPNIEQIQFAQGECVHKFLTFRIYFLFRELIKLKCYGNIMQGLPRRQSKGSIYTTAALFAIAKRELQTQLTTLWDSFTHRKLYEMPTEMDDQHFLYASWAESIVKRIDTLDTDQEMNISMAHNSHFFYLSISKQKEGYALRIDNRWMKTVPKNKQKNLLEKENPQAKESQKVRPHCVAWYTNQDKDIFTKCAKSYLEAAASLYWKESKEVMTVLYKDHKKLPEWIQWPYVVQQFTAQNCYMNNHDLGVLIRLKENLYNWFIKKETQQIVEFTSLATAGVRFDKSSIKTGKIIVGSGSTSAVQAQSANTKHQAAVSLTNSRTSLTPEPQLTAQEDTTLQVGGAIAALGAAASGALHRK